MRRITPAALIERGYIEDNAGQKPGASMIGLSRQCETRHFISRSSINCYEAPAGFDLDPHYVAVRYGDDDQSASATSGRAAFDEPVQDIVMRHWPDFVLCCAAV